MPGYSLYRFHCANENCRWEALRFCDKVETAMDPVDEIDVGMTWWAKHGCIACSFATICMRGRIVHANVGFDLNDAAGEPLTFQ